MTVWYCSKEQYHPRNKILVNRVSAYSGQGSRQPIPTVCSRAMYKRQYPPPSLKKDKVKTVAKDRFPFLDMKTSWSPEGDLQFRAFSNNGQQLKYVGKLSTHTLGTLHAIPSVVLNCLAKLTSRKLSVHPKRIESVYLN